MKLRTVVKIAIISSVVLLCTGFGVFSFLKLTAAKNQTDFDLYTLVPASAVAVIETDDVAGLIQDINELSCSKDNHFLYVSKLFSYLKLHLHTMLEDTPHGLSRQMNKMLISFHEPDNDRNQVLYCNLGAGDYDLVEKFIKKYCLSVFPSKLFDYKGEEIRIYPMPDNNFLACYFTSDFLAVSYQKKLIEQVIDARLLGKSLLAEEGFAKMLGQKRVNAAATIYTRMYSLGVGMTVDSIRSTTRPEGWAEYDMKLGGDAIYFSGISHDTDTCLTFMNMLRKQDPVEGFPGDVLPASAFFFSKQSVSNLQSMIDYTSDQRYTIVLDSDYVRKRDEEILLYLKENTGDDVVSCMFFQDESLSKTGTIITFPVEDVSEAERLLKSMLAMTPKEETSGAMPVTFCYTPSRAYPLYPLPSNTLLSQLTGVVNTALQSFACFYGGRLVLAVDKESLSSYIHYLEKKELLENMPIYEEGIAALTSPFNYMIMTDLSQLLARSGAYVRLLPGLFLRNQDFFRHFIISVQFTCTEEVIYPNIILLYKEGIN